MKKTLHGKPGGGRSGIDQMEDIWYVGEEDPRAVEERHAYADLAALNPLDDWQKEIPAVVEKILVLSQWRLERLRKIVRIQDLLGITIFSE